MNRGDDTRDAALALHESSKAAYLAEARGWAHRLYRDGVRPISTEDIRKVCPPPDGMEPRVMGSVFVRKDWAVVGTTQAKGHCNTRDIKLWMKPEDL